MKKRTPTVPVISDEPQKKLSWFRVAIAFGLMAAVAYGSIFAFKEHEIAKEVKAQVPWFAAYVDVTSTPHYAFEQLGSSANKHVVLAFIVASKKDACTPSWGTYYSLDEAQVTLDLERRIARLQQQEGQVAVSFGGALNDELALGCKDEDKLLQAYESVISRYNLDTIDLDLENVGLSDLDAGKRRATVIARLQEKRRSEGKSLAVWVTLPVAPQGLTQQGTDAVATLLSGGVDLAGVNLMTMDYGGSKEADQSMYDASQKALVQTHRQLGILYKQAGITLNSASLWRKIGATPMIGQNDVVAEVFSIDDAHAFNAFARARGVGRMSMWSANRDLPCGENYVDTRVVSDSCSGVKSEKFAFSKALGAGFEGDLATNAQFVTEEDTELPEQVKDDPATSPYQIWNEQGAYLTGTKVVWHGNVYEAKWWNKNEMPDNPVLQAWETPWQLIGPVLKGEKPIQQPKLPTGMYPEWSGSVEYQTGQRVLFEGVPFQAKWWNQGQSPAAAAANSDASPWVALTQIQINEILETASKSATPTPRPASKPANKSASPSPAPKQ